MAKIRVNYQAMEAICLADVEEFKSLGVCEETVHGPLIYIDNGSNVLGIAHLDSVQTTKHFYMLNIDGKEYVFNAQLDDRLGAYTLLSLLPKLGITCDVLLTYGEETGKSTAQFFKPTKKYKWMFQFDRRGEDVARYMYAGEFLDERLRRAGFKDLQPGMKTDICYLESMGCSGFNVACGYEDEHSARASADMEMYTRQVEKFMAFYSKFKNLAFVHTPKPAPVYVAPNYGNYNNYNWKNDNFLDGDGEKPLKITAKTGLVGKTEIRIIGGTRYLFDPFYNTYARCYHQKEQIGDVHFMDNCVVCERRLLLSDVYTKFHGVCGMCEPYTETCAVCNDYFSTKENLFEVVCPKCKPSGNVMTSHVCGNCDGSLYVNEVFDGFCKTCSTLFGIAGG